MKKFSLPLSASCFLLSAFCFLPSCTEPIDLRNDGMDPKLVITCILTDTIVEYDFFSENKVIITKATPFFDEYYIDLVDGAKVWLDSELLTMSSAGIYEPEEGFFAIPGKTYTLEVHYDMDEDGVDDIFKATTTVPPKCHLDLITLHPAPWASSSDFAVYMVLHYRDTIGHKYIGGKFNNENETRFYSDRLLRYGLFRFDLSEKDGEYRKVLAMDWFIQKEMAYDNANKYYIYAGDTLSVELDMLSEEYYRFLEMAKTELSHNNPMFSGPRANVPSNFTGGALGIFGSYTFSRAIYPLSEYTPGLPKRPE